MILNINKKIRTVFKAPPLESVTEISYNEETNHIKFTVLSAGSATRMFFPPKENWILQYTVWTQGSSAGWITMKYEGSSSYTEVEGNTLDIEYDVSSGTEYYVRFSWHCLKTDWYYSYATDYVEYTITIE